MSKLLENIINKARTAGITLAAIATFYTTDAQVLHGNNLRDGIVAPNIRDSTVLFANGVPQLKSVKYSGLDGKVEYTDADWTSTYVKQINNQIPNGYKLDQNYPNPFNPETIQRFSIPERTQVNITVYDILGRRVKEIINKEYAPGTYETNINLEGLANGIYFINMHTKNISKTNKALLLYGSQHAKTANIPTENIQENTQTGNTQNKTQTLAKTTAIDEARIFPSGDHFYAPDSIIIPITGNDTYTINGENGNDQEIKIINSLNYLTADSLVNDAKFTLSDGRERISKNGKISYVSKKGATIDNAIIEHPDFYRQNQYFIIPDKDTSQALLILQKNPKTGLENITEEQMDFIGQVCNLSWCNVDTLTAYFMNQDSSGRPYPQGTAPLDTTDTKQKAFMNKMLERMALDNEQSKNYNKPWGIYKNIKIKLNNIIPDWNTSGWGAFNYSNLYPSTFWASSGSQFDHNNPSVIISFGTNWNAKRTIIDMDGETYEFNRAIYSVNNAGNAGVPMWSMYNINSWIFRDITWDFQQAVDRYIQHIQNLPNGLSGINLGSQPNRTITLGHLGIIPKYPTTP